MDITIEIGNYDPIVLNPSPLLLIHSNYPPSDTVTVSFLGGTGDFNPPTLTFGPTVSAGTVVYTPRVVGNVAITAVISGPGVVDYSDTQFLSDSFFVAKRKFPAFPHFQIY